MEHKKNKLILIFLNILFKNGKKNTIEKKFFLLLTEIKLKTKQKPLFFFQKIIKKLLIKINVKKEPTRRNINIYCLKLLSQKQQLYLIFNWIFKMKTFQNVLNELIQLSKYKSKIFEKKKKHFLTLRQIKYNIKK